MRFAPLLLVALLLVAPPAAAQVPQACGPLLIPADPTAPATPLPPESSVDLVVQVQNAGRLAATVTVAAVLDAAGWRVVSEPAPTVVAGGAIADFRFTVRATEEAATDATVRFSASGTCETPLGASCPASSCVAASANTQVTIPLQPDQGFTIPGLENLDFPPEYLIAAIVLVGLASAIPFALRKKRTGIVATCPEPLKMVKPGRGTSFPIDIRNAGAQPASAQLEVDPVPEGWSAFMPLPEVQLAKRETRSLWLMVRSPAAAATGDLVDIELRLRDGAGNQLGPAVRVRAEVQDSGAA